MQRNTAGQSFDMIAVNITTGARVTGDALNITARISKDYGALTATTTLHPTEIADGLYTLPAMQGETDAHRILVDPVSATADVQVFGLPTPIYTVSAVGCPTADEIVVAIAAYAPDAINKITGQTITIKKGDGYRNADGTLRPYDFTKISGEAWPDTLTGWTIKLRAEKDPSNDIAGDSTLGPIAGTILTPTGSAQKVRIEFTEVNTATLSVGTGAYNYDLYADNGTKHVTLRSGPVNVRDEYSA